MAKKKFKLGDITSFSLFVPRSKLGLLKDYPELKKNRYLSNLRREKLLFCWYLGCEGSPCFDYYNSDDPEDRKAALLFVKEHSDLRMSEHEWEGVLRNMTLPADLSKAVYEFGTFRVGPRVRMLRMVENMLNNFEKVINVDINSSEFNVITKEGADTGERDYDKVKKYTDTCISIRNKFSELLEQAEKGFGTSEASEEQKNEVGQSFLDLKHEQNIK